MDVAADGYLFLILDGVVDKWFIWFQHFFAYLDELKCVTFM
jgi:hypothetical protein